MDTFTEEKITPSHLLNVLCSKQECKVGDKLVKMTKTDYIVLNTEGVMEFCQKQNASTYWLLVDHLGLMNIPNIAVF